MASFPNGLDTFTQHADNVRETIAAAHANTIQDALVAIEATLGTNPQGSSTSVKDRMAAIETNVSALQSNQGYSPPIASTTTRGIIKLAGDLSGTADAPRLTQLNNLSTISYADSFRKVSNLGQVSGAVTLDLSAGKVFTLTLTGNTTLSVVSWDTKALYQEVTVVVTQDATGGRALTWPTRFSTNSTLSGLSTAAGSVTTYRFYSTDIGANVFLGAFPSHSVPVQADRFDAAVLSLSNLSYYLPTEETTGTTATDASSGGHNGTYTGTFTLNSVQTVSTSTKNAPLFATANTNYITESVQRCAGAAAWSLGFTIKAPDPGLSAEEVIYSETLSTDATTNQGFSIASGTTALAGGKTACVMRLTNNSGSNLISKVLSSTYFDGIPHFVVVSFDGGNAYSVYFDGVLADSVVQAPTAATVDRTTWGARRRTTTDRYFAGGLGRLWLRTSVTTSAEIATMNSAFSNGGGGGGTGGGTNPPPTDTTYDSNGVHLGIPTVTVNNSSITASADIGRNASVNFAYLQIAVRPPAGSGGTAFSTAYTPGAVTGSGTQNITGTGTCDVAGIWTAFSAYSLVANPVQADWIDGTQVSFTIGTVAPPSSGGDGTTGGTGGTPVPGAAILGMSGATAASGSDDAWIGKAIDVAGTWNDTTPDGQINVYNIQPGQEYGSWNRYLDLAIGGVFSGETWAQAASGQFDSRWTQSLNNIKSAWGSRDPSKLFIRFAHEFNGDWYNWKVSGSDAGNFVTAWRRFRALQKQIIPLARLTWGCNDGTSGSLGLYLPNAFPGSAYVDVYSVDTYNQYPFSSYSSQADFDNYLNRTDSTGPVGPEAHRLKALEYGLPIGFGEWSSCGDPGGGGGGGDAPGYVNKFFDWIFQHQGSGAGNVLYAVQFNLWNQFIFHPTSLQPNAANAFKTRMLSRT